MKPPRKRNVVIIIISALALVLVAYLHHQLVDAYTYVSIHGHVGDVVILQQQLESYKKDKNEYPSFLTDLSTNEMYYQKESMERLLKENIVMYLPLHHDDVNDGYVLIFEGNRKRYNETFVTVVGPHKEVGDWKQYSKDCCYIRNGYPHL